MHLNMEYMRSMERKEGGVTQLLLGRPPRTLRGRTLT